MVRTPWGDSNELRDRRLRPGPGRPRLEIERNQRERLMAAMVAVSTTKGYADTSVGDLVELSGVSSRSFYDLFANKEACFLATMEEILAPARAITAAKMRQRGSWDKRAREAVETFVKLLVDQPAAARLCLVESYPAGPEAVRRLNETLAAFEELMQQAFDEQPDRRGMPGEITRAMVGGIRKIIHTRLHRGVEDELLEALPALMDLGLSYRPPPRPLRSGAGRRRRGDPSENGEARPGANGDGGAPAAAGGRRTGGDPGERILQATMEAVAANGYRQVTIADIVERAGVSLNTFYNHFDGKHAAFDAALYGGRTRMLGVLLPLGRRARNWPEAIRALTKGTLEFMAAEPQFAKLIAVDVYAAGPETLERRDQAIEAALWTLDGGLEYAPGVAPIAREAIMSALYAMLCDQVQAEGVSSLPEMGPLATYVALSPFIGPEQACEVANGGAWEAEAGAATTGQATGKRPAAR
jgi:AcrR family transcriptional regulator